MFRDVEPPRKVLVREATEHFNRAMMMTIYSLKCTNLLLSRYFEKHILLSYYIFDFIINYTFL